MKDAEEEDKKDEFVPKKEKFRPKLQNYEELSIKISNFIPVETDNDGKELPLRGFLFCFLNSCSSISFCLGLKVWFCYKLKIFFKEKNILTL